MGLELTVTLRRLVLPFVLVAALLGTPACHAPASVQTPTGKAAYTADQLVIRLGELENTVIAANLAGSLADRDATKLVRFCVDAAKVAKSAPAGWPILITNAWTQVKLDVPALAKPPLLTYVPLIDIALASF